MRNRRVWAIFVTVAVMSLGGVAYFLVQPERLPPEPVAGAGALPSPWRNLHPDVRYVGDDACAGCHAGVAQRYRRHPMARDLSPPEAVPPQVSTETTPFQKLGLHFQVKSSGGRPLHQVSALDDQGRAAFERADEVVLAIGSGTRGRSYVINRDGFLFQSPISWYAQPGAWDLSPGFARAHLAGLPIDAQCLFCHSQHAEVVAGTANRYRGALENARPIGCERCHGPGQLHVERRRRRGQADEPVDFTIVNPARLEPALREAVCQQCHFTSEYRVVRRGRGVFDYRPGLPFARLLVVLHPA